VTMMGFNRRLHLVIEQARAILAEGRLGKVHMVQTVLCEPPASRGTSEWRKHRTSGGGVLLDLASHHLDLLRFLLDDEFSQVEARIVSEASESDSAWLRMTMVRGTEIQSFFSCRSGLADSIQLLGECGTLRVDRFRSAVELRIPRRLEAVIAELKSEGEKISRAIAADGVGRDPGGSEEEDNRSKRSNLEA
jgi:myo-inositol 2-dehydrogenase/D-chiro-inositol 1-dehydrogenase